MDSQRALLNSLGRSAFSLDLKSLTPHELLTTTTSDANSVEKMANGMVNTTSMELWTNIDKVSKSLNQTHNNALYSW